MEEKHHNNTVSLTSPESMGHYRERLHILHVEDDEVDAILAQKAIHKHIIEEMQEYEIQIDFVTSLNDALKQVGKKPYHLILLDLALDDVKGPSNIRALKTQAPNIPIIVLTGACDSNTAFESIEDGADDYITKMQMGDPIFINAIKHVLKLKPGEKDRNLG